VPLLELKIQSVFDRCGKGHPIHDRGMQPEEDYPWIPKGIALREIFALLPHFLNRL
jgi:hypothetical protein